VFDRQFEALVQKVRETVTDNRVVIVMGWKSGNHTAFTRNLSEKKVRFYRNDHPPKSLCPTAGLVLCTAYVTHTEVARIRDRRMYNIALHYHTIIGILQTCKDLLIDGSPAAHTAVNNSPETVAVEPVGQSPPPDIGLPDDVLDFLTTPSRRHEMDNMDAFVESFLAAAKKTSDGKISKIVLAEMRRQFGIKMSNTELAKNGWVTPVIANGCAHAGSYRTGEKMLATVQQEKFEPVDPYERARHIVAQEGALLTERINLAKKIEEVDSKLARVETAKKAIKVLEDI
jgi:hypothetical protein